MSIAAPGYFKLIEPPGVIGMEGAGVIEALGPGVHAFKEGDRVGYACLPARAYAERRVMPANFWCCCPKASPMDEAAAGLLKGMAAEFLLHRIARVKEGDTILVHAAAVGVGLILCQWARALGRDGHRHGVERGEGPVARSHGCIYAIVATRDDIVEQVREITNGEGCRVVFDAVGRYTIARSIACLGV